MKRKWLLFPIFTLILILTLLPVGSLNASPGNLIKNGDFSQGADGLDYWLSDNVTVILGEAFFYGQYNAWLDQYISTSNKNLTLSLDIKPVDYAIGGIYVYFELSKGATNHGWAQNSYNSLPLNSWTNVSFKISDAWYDKYTTSLPDFDQIYLEFWTDDYTEAFMDNIELTYPETSATVVVPSWVRTMPMTCYRVWINEDNNFQFVFLYPYKDNNWVKIYAMNPDGTAGKEVFSVDMPHSNPNLIVDLPDGMYIVKTYHSDKPIQEFVIGKPADMSSEGADNTVNHEATPANHENTVNSR
jgi:hypothetical protein